MNTKTIDERIDSLLASIDGDKESMLYRHDSDHIEYKWAFHVGNPSNCVCLGEVDGILVFKGNSIESVLDQAEAHFLNGHDND
jgi:hypothetical protein